MKAIHKLSFTGLALVFITTPIHAKAFPQSEQITTMKSEIVTLQESITKLNDNMAENQKKLDKTQKEIKQTKAMIEEKTTEIAQLEESILKRVDILKGRATSLQQQNRSNIVIDVIVHSRSLPDLIENMTSLQVIFDADTQLMNQLEQEQAVVEKEKEEVQKKKNDLEKKQSAMKQQQQGLTEQEQSKQSVLANLQKELDKAIESQIASKQQLEATSLFIADNSVDKKSVPIVQSPLAKVNSNVKGIVSIGLSYQGVPYVFGGKSPSGFDCSGFVYYVFGQGGRNVGYQTAAGYYNSSTKVSTATPGDLVFFSNTYMSGVSHVGIYIGGNSFVHAGGNQVQVTSLSNSYWSAHFTGFGRL